MSSVRRPHGRLFQIRGPAAPKLLSHIHCRLHVTLIILNIASCFFLNQKLILINYIATHLALVLVLLLVVGAASLKSL